MWVQPENLGVVQGMALPVVGPDISCDGIVGKHQCTYWTSMSDIQKRRISTKMRGHIVMRKLDRIGTAMIMHSQIHQSIIRAPPGNFGHEASCQAPITSLTTNRVHSVT